MFCVSSIGDTSERETQKEVENLVFPYMEGEGFFFSFLGTFDKKEHKEQKEMSPGPEEEDGDWKYKGYSGVLTIK